MTDWRKRHLVVPAVYVIFRHPETGKVLLIRRANTGYRDGDYSMPSGHLEGGEPAIAAAIRETKEEVGVGLAEKDLTLVHVQHRVAEERDHERIDFFFEASKWQGEPYNAEPDKCSGLLWADPSQPPHNLVPEVGELFKCLPNNEPYGHFGFDG